MSQCSKLTANGGALFGPAADVKSTVDKVEKQYILSAIPDATITAYHEKAAEGRQRPSPPG